MKIIKLITYAVGISVTLTVSAAALDAVSEYKKQNISVAVMKNNDGDGIEELTNAVIEVSSLIERSTDLAPDGIGKPLKSALRCIREGAKKLTQLVIRFIYRS